MRCPIEDGICDGPGECNPEVLLSQFLAHVVLLPLFDQWEPELTQPHQRTPFFSCHNIIIVGRTTWRKAGFSMIQNP
jgi:hypothetical protein